MIWQTRIRTSFIIPSVIMYLFLSSGDGVEYNANNSWNDFTVQLPNPTYLSQEYGWEIGLIDFYINTNKNAGKLDTLPASEIIHICCDEVDASVVNGTESSILGTVRLKDCVGSIMSFPNPLYMTSVVERLTSLHIYLRHVDGSIPSLDNGKSFCTLHIRQRA